jgi:hypothetical protein
MPDKDLSASRPPPKLEDHTLSVIRDRLLNIIAATLHIGGRSSIRTLRVCHAVMRVTHFVMELAKKGQKIVYWKNRRHSLCYWQRDRHGLFETVAHEQVADLYWSPPVQDAYERTYAK